ncbi:MAG: mannose-6-phosphate isomerase, class I [Chitinophagaceae bacterium]|nr:MAG: mannose-6-phosphate isomerase, class I [Chitinophagaceae bacterium]
MKSTGKIYRLEGRVQHYAWGGYEFLPALLQVPNVGHKPFAEYWMGAHSKAPSMITMEDNSVVKLDAMIAADAQRLLGAATATRFGRLPYLFKILDVRDMLSIQVHPTRKDAMIAYDLENASEIDIDDPRRNYKDDNHKPELMYALSDFWLLHGFKTPGKLQRIIAATPELEFLWAVYEEGGYAGLYRYVMELDQDRVNERLQPLLERILPLYEKGMLEKSDENFWAARAALTFNDEARIDRGIFSIYIFNLVNLKKGESIFQDAGLPHAYLEGQNVEIMANSDNVLRGGLTPKHIDVPELLKHVKCEPLVPAVILGIPSNHAGEEIFLTPAADFELRAIRLLPGESTIIYSHTTDIFFVYAGTVTAKENEISFERDAGEAFLAVSGASIRLYTEMGVTIYRATVPAG